MKNTETLRNVIASFEGVRWATCGTREDQIGENRQQIAWVKFQLEKSENGWRTLEFLTWCLQDASRDPLAAVLFPVTAPPVLNEPGECICFLFEVPITEERHDRAEVLAVHLAQIKEEDWPQCRA
jgi:hypothetical protein